MEPKKQTGDKSPLGGPNTLLAEALAKREAALDHLGKLLGFPVSIQEEGPAGGDVLRIVDCMGILITRCAARALEAPGAAEAIAAYVRAGGPRPGLGELIDNPATLRNLKGRPLEVHEALAYLGGFGIVLERVEALLENVRGRLRAAEDRGAEKVARELRREAYELLTLLNWPLEAGVPAPGGSVYERLQRSPDDASEAPPA